LQFDENAFYLLVLVWLHLARGRQPFR